MLFLNENIMGLRDVYSGDGLICLYLAAQQLRRFVVMMAECAYNIRQFSQHKTAVNSSGILSDLLDSIKNDFYKIRDVLKITLERVGVRKPTPVRCFR